MSKPITISGMRISEYEDFKPNPRNVNMLDAFHMYAPIGKNAIIFYRRFSDEVQPYLIIANPLTGKRIKIEL